MGIFLDDQRTYFDRIHLCCICLHSGPAQERFDASHHFQWIERLGNIVVRACRQPLDFIHISGFCAQHQNRDRIVLFPQLPHYRDAILLRHHHIQNDQLDIHVLLKLVESVHAVIGFYRIVSFIFAINAQQIHDFPVVIDDQNFTHIGQPFPQNMYFSPSYQSVLNFCLRKHKEIPF